MKYKVGDKIKYKHTGYVEDVCLTCGHEEIGDAVEEIREGVITHASLETLYRLQNIMETSEEVMENGHTVTRPYMSDIKVIEPEPYYRVGNDGVTEDQIVSP